MRQSRLPFALRASAVVVVSFSLAASAAHAQTQTVFAPPFPAKVANTSRVTIGGTFSVAPVPAPLTQNSQTGGLCSPGACYTGTVVAKGNQGWKLQVRLASEPAPNAPGVFTVYYVQTTVPPTAQAVNSGTATLLNTTTWLTIAQGTSASAGTSIGMMFNARRSNGNTGLQPTAAQLMPFIAYQVVANP